MFDRERLTLSVEATEARVLVARDQRILRWASAPLPRGTVQGGRVVQPTAFGDAVRRLVEELGGSPRKAVVSLNGQGSLVRILDMPTVPPHMRDEAVRREARRELPLPLDELYLSWHVIADQNQRLQVFTLGTPREAIDNCVLGLRGTRVRPVAMDLKPLALVRAVNLPDVLLADLEKETGAVVLVRGFVPHIARSIAPPGEADRPLSERANHLVVEIRRTLDFYSSTLADDHASWSPVVCLTGAFGADEELRQRIGEHWPLVEPDPPLTVPEGLPLLPYLVNVGLALKRLH